MTVSIIVAMAKNRVIGRDNQLPWTLPNDLKYFKAVTMGKPIIMGRKTFESIGRPLPGRQNIVITRNKSWSHEGVTVVSSVDEALDTTAGQDVMITGGGQIYAECMDKVERLYITEVDAEVEGDAFFPEFDKTDWQQLSRAGHPAEDGNPAYDFVVYSRL